ncbi:nucleoid-associated protein YgaU [Catenulispora sp. EB89]|uniref:LysM peptidoglycan-binding domain-containing protein n=1 Tax=Catenulispora sp. EB89 TaxID=3156257 RepID=UPI003511B904
MTIDNTQAALAAAATPSSYPRTSRYYAVPTAVYTTADGTQIPYLTRRFLPDPGTLTAVDSYQVKAGDRVDQIAYRYLGDPTQWWQLADANPELDPQELTATPGATLEITLPGGMPSATPGTGGFVSG